MGLAQRTSVAVAGLHWGGCIIDVIRAIEAPAVHHDIPVIHDYFGFNAEPPHNSLLSTTGSNLWCVDDACGKGDNGNSFIVRASVGDTPADLPWIFHQVASLNEDSRFSNIQPINTLVVLAERMSQPWDVHGEHEKRIAESFHEAGIKTILLVRVDVEGVPPLDSARSYAAFRHVAKMVGGVCCPFRRENITDIANVAGHYAADLNGELTRDNIQSDIGKKFFMDCLAASSLG